MSINSTRPLFNAIKHESQQKKLDGTTAATVEELIQIVEIAEKNNDTNAEALGRFQLANRFDGNVDSNLKLDHDRAVKELDRAIELFPSWMEARFNRAIALLHSSDYSKSIKEFEKVEEMLLGNSPNILKDSNSRGASSILGRTLLFRAEARTKRGLADDNTRARHEIDQSLVWLALSDNAMQWIKQLPARTNATYRAQPEASQPAFHQLSVIIGAVFAMILLLICVVLASCS